MKIFFHDFFHVCLYLFLAGTIVSGACSSRKNESAFTERRADEKSSSAVNINDADAEALQRVPSVGPALARKIIEHRTRYGKFRRIENIMLIEGVSDRRFREIRHWITVD